MDTTPPGHPDTTRRTPHHRHGHHKVPGRVLSWLALSVALGASVAANVASALHGTGPRLSAATAPVLVVLAAGLLERVRLVGVRWWQRLMIVGALVFIVVAAFATSYQHQYELLVRYGNPALSAVALPFAVDALIVMSSVCLAVIAEQRRQLAALADTRQPVVSDTAVTHYRPASVQPADTASTTAPTSARTLVNTTPATDTTSGHHQVINLSAATRDRQRNPGGELSVEQLADTLGRLHEGKVIGKPTAQATLRRAHGSCSNARAIAAKDIHNARVSCTDGEPDTDDQERHQALAAI